MSGTIRIGLAKPVMSVKIADNYHARSTGSPPQNGLPVGDAGVVEPSKTNSAQDTQQLPVTQDVQRQQAEVTQLCRMLNKLVDKLNRFYDEVLARHKEEIAKLSVEIARKILMHKVQKGDYEIESILKEALKNAPTYQDLVVHLNPLDLPQCQKLQQEQASSALAQIKFVADANIGRAECLLESPKGIVSSFIDEHIERISEALEKVQ